MNVCLMAPFRLPKLSTTAGANIGNATSSWNFAMPEFDAQS